MAPKLPLKDARMANGHTLVMVAAKAECSIGLVQKFELCPEAVSDPRKRQKLADVYARFVNEVVA